MVCFENVDKFILSGVSFSVPGGQAVGIIGPSGAGKTTLLKLAGGLLAPAGGRVRILGKEPMEAQKWIGRSVGACIEGLPLFEAEDKVEEGLRMLRIIYQIPRKQFLRDCEELSERLKFKELAGRRCGELSAGQRMRVRLGAVLLPRPSALLLDEPTIGLDAEGRAALGEILAERRGQGVTVLMASHDMEAVSGLCSRLLLLERGRVVFYGSERTLRQRYAPADEITVRLAGRLPDPEDLPLESYVIEGDILRLRFRPDRITAAEIMGRLLCQTRLTEVNIRRAGLEDILLQKNGGNSERDAVEKE